MVDVVLDVDGVLLDLETAYDKFSFDLNSHEHHQIFSTSNEFARLEPIDGAVELINLLDEKNLTFKLVSSCVFSDNPVDINRTIRLRQMNLLDVLGIQKGKFIGIDTGISKKDVISELEPKLFVDDHVVNLEECNFVEHRLWFRRENASRWPKDHTDDETIIQVKAHTDVMDLINTIV